MAISEEAVNFQTEAMSRGRAIPGQSLTNDPDQKYSWEQPPELTSTREASVFVFEILTVPETTENILLSLNKEPIIFRNEKGYKETLLKQDVLC